MALSAGTRLGPYEILAAIGAGGMGEVYRARDTKLNRDVALKVLPEAFTTDPDRLARFKREAHVLAALNHPNIAAIYGFEESDGVRALVLELVEGPTLADHIAKGALHLDEALHIARQIAVALEAAHEQGIIHRDLKPANVKVREDDTVKVLDFGLAKALEPAGISSNASQSPTMTSPAMTQAGIILGTAAYMSPEQAKGRATDKRSDIWAFGCTLYEMLTGKRAFEGENVSDTLAAVLRGEPDWAAFPPGVPPHVRTIVRRCLEKDRKARIPDIAVVRFMLDDANATTTTPAALDHTTTRHIGRRGWIAAALLGVGFLTASGLAAFVYFRQTPADERAIRFPIRFPVAMPNGWSLTMPFPSPGAPPVAVSPDGRRVAFVAVRQGIQHLWVRSLDSIAAQELPATEGAGGPFWDPDSRMLAFFAGDKLKRIDITGGRLLTLCDAPLPGGGAWSSEGFILFGSYGKGIQSVAAGGGVPTVVTTLAQGEAAHEKPSFLPDGRHFFYRAYTASAAIGSLYIGSIESTDRTMVKVEADATAPATFCSSATQR
jgi:eukaryotic-like serine/threonine-protein kinase